MGIVAALALTLPFAACGEVRHEDAWVVWGSNRTGEKHDIYMSRADGSRLRRVTTSGGSHPSWSPDGRWIAYTALPSEAGRVVRWDGSEDHQVCEGSPVFWLHDGRGLVCRQEDRYTIVEVDRGQESPLFTKGDFPALEDKELNPSDISPDGRFLVGHTDRYRRRFEGSNGSFRAYHAAVLLDFDHPEQIFFIGNGCQPSFSPVDDWIYHVCGGGRECPLKFDIMRLRISDRKKRTSYEPVVARPDVLWGHTYQPRVSNDGRWLTYAATTDGCHDQDTCDYEVFLEHVDRIARKIRLTRDPGNDQWPHLWVGPLWQATESHD